VQFTKSQDLLLKALKTMPIASQTFSKSYLQYPHGCSPLFVDRGEGAVVWDVDGNEYVDLVSGLMAVTLGYNDPAVNEAIVSQISKGISFSLSTELEYELSSRLIQLIPCAEKVQFVKNGSDATSAAIRIARSVTTREHVAVCGYHGWHDWYIGSTTRDKGIPSCVKGLVHTFPYNDLAALEALLIKYPMAAVIMEPTNVTKPDEGFLQAIKALTHRYGSLFIFDEIITGFHFSLGGAQEYFSVIPDLACIGKGMGNGMPISAVVGKAEYMDELKEVFVSGTFSGEALSLAAAIAVIDKMQDEQVIEHFWRVGAELSSYVEEQINTFELQSIISLHGYAPWKILQFHAQNDINANYIKSFFMREMIQNHVLIISSHNMNYAHGPKEIEVIKRAYVNSFDQLSDALKKDCLRSSLGDQAVLPIFKIR